MIWRFADSNSEPVEQTVCSYRNPQTETSPIPLFSLFSNIDSFLVWTCMCGINNMLGTRRFIKYCWTLSRLYLHNTGPTLWKSKISMFCICCGDWSSHKSRWKSVWGQSEAGVYNSGPGEIGASLNTLNSTNEGFANELISWIRYVTGGRMLNSAVLWSSRTEVWHPWYKSGWWGKGSKMCARSQWL